jgi:hypothetical protein
MMNKYIVFVHGLGGELDKTWGQFPEFIINDATIDYKVIEYGYTSPNPVKQFYLPAPSILSIANGLLTDLEVRCDLENDDIILIGHSLGGLVIRRMLLRLNAKGINHNIRKVCFFDVPHEGSGFAKVGNYIAWFNRHLKALSSNSSELDDLNEQWVDKKLDEHLNILSVIDANETVVSAMSSKSIFRFHDIKTVNSVNHSTIVKPETVNDTTVLILKTFINSKPSIGKFNSNSSSKSLDKWLKYDERRHELAYLEDQKRECAYQGMVGGLSSSIPLVRLTGLSGLGKSRLLLEYKNRTRISDEDFLIYNGSGNEDEVISSFTLAVENKAEGLAIVDNCPVELHNKLSKILSSNNSPLKVVTTFFYHDPENSLEHCIQIKLDKLEDDKISQIIDSRLPDLDSSSKTRLNKFIEGFPLLADMATKELQSDGIIRTSFSEGDLVEKLINGDNNLTDNQRELLKVFSLFDYFRFQKNQHREVNEDAVFLNKIAGTSQIEFEGTVKHFENKELINCTGNIARLVPKPLALNLAMEWWNSSYFDRQSEVVSMLPPSMLESFCDQIKYLDASENVQSFVENFCDLNRPFGQAELLLTKQGSRLFRALVEVNPNITSCLLYRVLNRLTDDDIGKIDGDVRRNLVWSLEMLVFHQTCFEKSSWCLFKLAQFENESYGNNSLVQFSQLFRWQLSGTEADFTQRLAVLNKALVLNIDSADIVIIKAVKTAIDTRGGTRTIGAEFQGTKPELKEWQPQKYQEIYDYWQSLLDILLEIIKRGRLIEQVKDAFGHEIRGLIRYKMPEQLDAFIKEVIKLSGKYWPSAAQSITHALHYDEKGMQQEQVELLKSWEKLLAPDKDNIEEKLKLIVLNPSREHEKGHDGHYVDMAAEDAILLSTELKDSHAELIPYLDLLMTFPEQKQSWVFAKYLVVYSDDITELLEALLEFLRNHKRVNTQFVSGFLAGLYAKSPDEWIEVVELFGADERLIEYFPDTVRTGNFDCSHLNTFIELIKSGKLPSHTASILAYGRATEHLTEDIIAQFCMSLSKVDPTAVWVALDNINMYTHGRKNINFEVLNPVLVHLVLNVSFNKEDKTRHSDSYRWLSSVEKLLKTEGEEFALKICQHLIEQVGNNDVDYSDLWDYLGNAFYKAFELHGNFLWPKLADKFIDASAIKQYRLIDLLGSGKSFRKRDNSIFDLIDQSIIIDWCHDEVALIIVGRAISMFIEDDEKRVINPLIVCLISEYGDNKAFVSEISANFSSRSWSGSLVPYLEYDKVLIQPLTDHENTKVKSWAVSFVEYIDHQIEYEEKQNAEENMLRS